jgi:drug/metabolite transporter (DMT)-like permease
MDGIMIVVELVLLRIVALAGERVVFHALGKGQRSALPTMCVAFGGAAIILWLFAMATHQVTWVGLTIWIGAVYAGAFGLYTKALAMGPVSTVSAWTNLTIVLLWFIQPTGGVVSTIGIVVFTGGAWLLLSRQVTRAVWLMVCSDILFIAARLLDASHTHIPTFSYAASLYTSISLWMVVPVLATAQTRAVVNLVIRKPIISLAAAVSNGVAYVTLFALLHWMTPALVESISSLAGFAATLAGIWVFHEEQGMRKISASLLMTIGVLMLLFSQDFT